ncbi:MAG: 6-bladed beta-propeller [Candidatus Delongbacteria bacterium]|jgi:hypothetical protein|nr:6-bladed beta-propeller [Candidatus Delongbacteria bacterium]
MKFISIIVLTISILSNLHAGDKTYKVKTDSKGVKTFYNKKPADPNFKIELKKIGEISPDYLDTLGVNGIAVYDYDFDAKGDITILDHNRMWKFNKNGRFINKWSRNGYGPGEFQVPFNFFMLNDTIYVSNSVSRKIIKFDNDGKFINDIHIENSLNYPKDIICAYDKYLLGYSTRYSYEKERNIDRIVMFDSKTFEIKKSLFE